MMLGTGQIGSIGKGNRKTGPQIVLYSILQQTEGNSGTKTYTFPVVLAGGGDDEVTVDWAVTAAAENPAQASDFQGGVFPSGTVTFTPGGSPIQNIVVTTVGDTAFEADEGFVVTLSNAVGAEIAIGQGLGTIINDDADPTPAISLLSTPVVHLEGTASDTVYTFTLNRTGPDLSGSSSVAWAVTGSGANPAGMTDFVGDAFPSGTATFAADETVKNITVTVKGEPTIEPDEQFTVTISSPTNAYLLNATCTATITNDDVAPGAIADLAQASVTATSITLSFTNASNAVSHQYRLNGGTPAALDPSKVITGLTAETAYDIEVRGVNASADGPWSNVLAVTTPAAPTNLYDQLQPQLGSNLLMVLDPSNDAQVTISGSQYQTWTDPVTGAALTQATAGKRPLVDTASFPDAAYFDGADDFLGADSVNAALRNGCHVFVAFENDQTAVAMSAARPVLSWGDASISRYVELYFNPNTGTGFVGVSALAFNSASTAVRAHHTLNVVTGRHVACLTHLGAGTGVMTLEVDGTSVASASHTWGQPGSLRTRVGAGVSGTSGLNGMKGRVAAVVVVSLSAPTEQLDVVRSALQALAA